MVAVKVSQSMPATQFSNKKHLSSSGENSFAEIMDKMATAEKLKPKESFGEKKRNEKKDFENKKNYEQAQEILAAQILHDKIEPKTEQQPSEMSNIQGDLVYQATQDIAKAMADGMVSVSGLQNISSVGSMQELLQKDTGLVQISDETIDIAKLLNDILAKNNAQTGISELTNKGIKPDANQSGLMDENSQKLFGDGKIVSGSVEVDKEASTKGIINDNKGAVQGDKLSQGKINLSLEKADQSTQNQGQTQLQAATIPHISTLNPDNTNIKVGEAVQVKSETFIQDFSDKIIVNIKEGVKEFNIRLNPESLGSVTIKIVFEADKALITMGCENQKAQAALAQSSEAIKSIIQQNVGTQTIIIVQENPQQGYQQQQQQQSQQQQQQSSPQEQDQLEVEDVANFLNQLKLGLINT